MFVFLQGPTFELCRHGHNEGGFRRDVGAHFRSKMLIHRPSFQHFSWNSLCVVGFPPLLSPGPPSDLFFRAGCRAPTHRFAQLGDHYGGSLFLLLLPPLLFLCTSLELFNKFLLFIVFQQELLLFASFRFILATKSFVGICINLLTAVLLGKLDTLSLKCNPLYLKEFQQCLFYDQKTNSTN